GAQAKAAGLVDELGTFTDAVRIAGEQAKIKGKPKIYYPRKPARPLLDALIGRSDSNDESWGGSDSLVGRIFGLTAENLDRRVALGLTPGIYWLWNGP